MSCIDPLSTSLLYLAQDHHEKLVQKYPEIKTMDLTWISQKLLVTSQAWSLRSEKKSRRNNVTQLAAFLHAEYDPKDICS